MIYCGNLELDQKEWKLKVKQYKYRDYKIEIEIVAMITIVVVFCLALNADCDTASSVPDPNTHNGLIPVPQIPDPAQMVPKIPDVYSTSGHTNKKVVRFPAPQPPEPPRIGSIPKKQTNIKKQTRPVLKPPPSRTLKFPNERSLGQIMVRDWSPNNVQLWQKIGPAKGIIDIPAGKELKIDFTSQETSDLTFLNTLKQNTVQALEFNSKNLADSDLKYLKGFSRLRELDIRSPNITDTGLEYIKKLDGLQELRLSPGIISEKAFAELVKALPSCRIILTETLPQSE